MFHYKFPIIRTIDDVLPHIEGCDEFIVAEREYGTVINYAVRMDDTFPPINVAGGSAKMRAERALTNAIRRECRGLIFYPDGRIMSRPFHKFFNIGERDETLPHNIDLTRKHVRMEKLDGSMIRPVDVHGQIKLGTKMGVTEVSDNADKWLRNQPDLSEKMAFIEREMMLNRTPIFEWCSSSNQIVIDYPEDDLVLTAIRDNITGEYIDIRYIENHMFNVVKMYGSVTSNISDYIAKIEAEKDREGEIIRFEDGHMLKEKNNWYVRIHKTLEKIQFDRNIVELILNDELDDALAKLPKHRADWVRDFYSRFSDRLHKTCESYERYWNTVVASGLDRKRYAQEWMPTIKGNDPFAPAYVFGRFVGKDGRAMIIEQIQKHISTNVKWNECAKWLGLD